MTPVQVALISNWWSLVVRGIVAILFGLLSLAMPGITVHVLVLLFAFYALLDGVVNLVGAVRASKAHERWGALVIEGIIGIVAAFVTFAWPAITAITLIYVVAFWAIVTGVLEIMAAFRLRKHIAQEWLLGLAGVASILFGIALIAFPLTGALVIAMWIGVYALIFGFVLIGLGIRLRGWARRRTAGPAAMAATNQP